MSNSIACPKCIAPLVLKEAEGHIGFRCAQCDGLWLPGKYLASLQHIYTFNADDFRTHLAGTRTPAPQAAPCPSCGQYLAVSRLKDIELDWCERCGGVWFDKSELTRLVTYQHQLTRGQKIAMGALDGVQVVALLMGLFSGG